MILVGHSKVEMQRRIDFIRADYRARFSEGQKVELKDAKFNSQNGQCMICLDRLLGLDGSLSVLDHAVSMYNWAEQHIPMEEAAQFANAVSNLRLVHVECNRDKGCIELEEYHDRRDAGEFRDSDRRTVEEAVTYRDKHSAGMKTWHASRTPEDRSASSGLREWRNALTPEQRSEHSRRSRLDRSPEELHQMASQGGKVEWAQKTPEERKAFTGLGQHQRWHVQRNEFNPDCVFCRQEGVGLRTEVSGRRKHQKKEKH